MDGSCRIMYIQCVRTSTRRRPSVALVTTLVELWPSSWIPKQVFGFHPSTFRLDSVSSKVSFVLKSEWVRDLVRPYQSRARLSQEEALKDLWQTQSWWWFFQIARIPDHEWLFLRFFELSTTEAIVRAIAPGFGFPPPASLECNLCLSLSSTHTWIDQTIQSMDGWLDGWIYNHPYASTHKYNVGSKQAIPQLLLRGTSCCRVFMGWF